MQPSHAFAKTNPYVQRSGKAPILYDFPTLMCLGADLTDKFAVWGSHTMGTPMCNPNVDPLHALYLVFSVQIPTVPRAIHLTKF